MEDQPQVRANNFKSLVIDKFDKSPLSDAEKLLLEKVVTGGWAFCGPKPKDTGPDDSPPKEDKDPANNPRGAGKWKEKEKREIRAELVAWLCTDHEAQKHVHGRGIRVYGAVITGPLNLSLLNIPFQLAFQHCRLGVIKLQQAEVSQLDLQGSLVGGIRADSLIVKKNVALRGRFKAKGEVRFPFAQIGGVLDCSGGTFMNPPQVDAQGKHLEGSGSALNAGGIDVRGYVSFNNGFKACGEVNLVCAQIGGGLDCAGGTFKNRLEKGVDGKYVVGSGSALNADGVVVKGSVFLMHGFKAVGTVSLYGAQIGGNFACVKGNFEKATLDLRDASAASLWDSGLNDKSKDNVADFTKWPPQLSEQPSEPPPCKLLLDGFEYGRISSDGNINATKRLEWLGRGWKPGEPFRRQPYLHLVKVLQDSGHSGGALDVRIKMAELSITSEAGGKPSSKWLNKKIRRIRIGIVCSLSWFLKWSIGYGYRPRRAIGCIFLLSVLGTIVYDRSYYAGTMVPTDGKAYAEFMDPKTERQVPSHYPSFTSFVYSLENSLPLVKLGQGEKWQPYPGSAAKQPTSFVTFVTSPWFVRMFLRIQILLGWLFATLFVAGVSGIVHNE